MKTMDTAAIEATVHNALETLNPQELPARVDSWIVEAGFDSTDDPAVWVWGILSKDKVDTATRAQLRERVRVFVRDAIKNEVREPISWVYVRFRTPSELEELREIEEEEKREALETWGEP